MSVKASRAAAPESLRYPRGDVPAPGTPKKVAPGVHWLRMPLPFALDHVNLWILDDGEGWTAVDTGLALDETRALWRALFAGALASAPLKRLVVTHFHPDHIGLAGWLAAERGCELWATRTEWLMHRLLVFDAEGVTHRAQIAVYRENGLEAARADELERRGNTYRTRVVPAPDHFRRLREGDDINIGGRSWRVMVGTGHAPEHASLYCPEIGVLIAGDQILPKITPNVGLWASEPAADPLADYLGSLEQFRRLPAATLVLPSHGRPFLGLHARLDEVVRHHEARLERVLAACARPATAADVMKTLFRRPLDAHQVAFAMGESLAHLVHLAHRGRLARRRDADGLVRYVRAPG